MLSRPWPNIVKWTMAEMFEEMSQRGGAPNHSFNIERFA